MGSILGRFWYRNRFRNGFTDKLCMREWLFDPTLSDFPGRFWPASRLVRAKPDPHKTSLFTVFREGRPCPKGVDRDSIRRVERTRKSIPESIRNRSKIVRKSLRTRLRSESRSRRRLRSDFGRPWGSLGSSRAPSWRPRGDLEGSLGAPGVSWEAPWGSLGASWGALGRAWGTPGGPQGSQGAPGTDFVSIFGAPGPSRDRFFIDFGVDFRLDLASELASEWHPS